MKSPLVLFAEGAAFFLRLVRQGQVRDLHVAMSRSTIVRHGRTFAQEACVTVVTEGGHSPLDLHDERSRAGGERP